MKNLFLKIVNLILYSNLWIGLCALSMVLQTDFFLYGHFVFTSYAGLVFTATLFLYAIHRIVGLKKVKPFQNNGRYLVISTFKSHISIYAFLAGAASFFFFLQLSIGVQISLVIPAILSLGYVLPVWGNKRRLRDFNFIKIFLIAIVWAWVTVLLPALEAEKSIDLTICLMTIERACFIFAITLPFDIRDIHIDQHTGVKTIPNTIGIQCSKYLAIATLLFMLALVYSNFQLAFYSINAVVAFILSIFITYGFVHFSEQEQHDYYYTAGVDGMMLVQAFLVIGISLFISSG